MHIALRMLPEVDHQGLRIAHGGIEVVIQGRVIHQQSERALAMIDLVGHLLNIAKGLVDLSHGTSHIDRR